MDRDSLLSSPFKVFRKPEPDKIYVAGVDTSEGLGHGDNSCVQILEHLTGEQVAVYTERIAPDILAANTYRLGRYYNGALLMVEANNIGIATLTILKQLGYRSIFRRRFINHVFNRETEEFGFKTTSNTKPLIIAKLDQAIRDNGVILHEIETLVELRGYTRDEKGRMSGSPFDDRVMALALANHGREFVHQRIAEAPPDDETWTLKWWRRLLDVEPERFVVGGHARSRK